jgi:hypothetical protein
MKTVSPFEFAIMQAVHETNPEKVTSEDLSKVRPETQLEQMKRREEKFDSFISNMRYRTQADEDLAIKVQNEIKRLNP